MGGSTGNIRTQRWQSGTVGSRTLGSILAGTGGGAGGTRRIYAYYVKQNNKNPFNSIFDINYGQFRDRTQWFLSTEFP